METYNGHVRSPTDAIILFEACRLGLLPRVQRRLSEKERQQIRSGSVFVWDEREAGMRRWTDGKSWSASRVSGSFLTYREMEGKRGGSAASSSSKNGNKTPDRQASEGDGTAEAEEGPDGYRYKPDGLMKQSFSITTSQGQHLHLISYYARSHPTAPGLRQPSTDPSLSQIQPQKGMYPETTVSDQTNVPAVTQAPMAGAPNYALAGYARQAAQPQAYLPQYPQYYHPHVPPHGYPMHYAPMPPPVGYPHYAPMHLPMGQHPPPPPPPLYDQRPSRQPEHEQQAPASALPTPASASPATNSGPYGTKTQPYIPSPAPAAMGPAPRPPSQQSSSTPAAAIAPVIDPTLTAEPVNGVRDTPEHQPSADASSTNIPTTASQAPTIGALVNGEHENQQPPPQQPREQQKSSPTPIPAKIDTTNNITANSEPSDHSSTLSPSGAPPQDIPSEKLGFREDTRALRQLDKVFGM